MLAEQWLQTAERLLREVRGGDLRLRPTHEFREARVARCTVEHSRRDADTVIVKVPHTGGDGYRGLRSLHNEQAALELLDDVNPGASPCLLAADPSLGVCMLEDLGDGPSLATTSSTTTAKQRWLRPYGRQLPWARCTPRPPGTRSGSMGSDAS